MSAEHNLDQSPNPFEQALDDSGFDENWTPGDGANDVDKPSPDAVKEVSNAAGFDRDNAPPDVTPKKEPTEQISIRAPQSVVNRFKDLCTSQSPKWPQAFALERMMDALERDMQGKGG